MTTRRRGRPRSFDRDDALRQAMLAFWQHGYDAVSIADLTDAMGIQAPSLYAAFGDKRTLFDEAVELYARVIGGYLERAIEEEATAFDAVARLLREAAAQQTLSGHPRGCLIIHGATNSPPRSASVAASLQRRRDESRALIEQRITADIDAGRLPPDTDAHALASYSAAVLHGMALQARDGADRAVLEAIAAAAMRAWPRPPGHD